MFNSGYPYGQALIAAINVLLQGDRDIRIVIPEHNMGYNFIQSNVCATMEKRLAVSLQVPSVIAPD